MGNDDELLDVLNQLKEQEENEASGNYDEYDYSRNIDKAKYNVKNEEIYKKYSNAPIICLAIIAILSFGCWPLLILIALIVSILIIRRTNYKKMRDAIDGKMRVYASENNLNFSEGSGYTRTYIDKTKKVICIYKQGQIIRLNFDNIIKVETLNNEKIEVSGSYQWGVYGSSYYDNSEIKIYTNTNEAVISLKYIRGSRVGKKNVNSVILNHVEEASRILNYALAHKSDVKQTKQSKPKSEANHTTNTSEIRELKKLLDEGIITEEEFKAKKKQLLGI